MDDTNSYDTYPSKIFTSAYNTHFKHIPYPCQSSIGNGVINSFLIPTDPIQKICIRPTGLGKTLIFTIISPAFKSVTLCITPIISLGADQSKNLNNRVFAEAWLTLFSSVQIGYYNNGRSAFSLLQILHPQQKILNFGSKITRPSLLSPQRFYGFWLFDKLHIFIHFGKIVSERAFVKMERGVYLHMYMYAFLSLSLTAYLYCA